MNSIIIKLGAVGLSVLMASELHAALINIRVDNAKIQRIFFPNPSIRPGDVLSTSRTIDTKALIDGSSVPSTPDRIGMKIKGSNNTARVTHTDGSWESVSGTVPLQYVSFIKKNGFYTAVAFGGLVQEEGGIPVATITSAFTEFLALRAGLFPDALSPKELLEALAGNAAVTSRPQILEIYGPQPPYTTEPKPPFRLDIPLDRHIDYRQNGIDPSKSRVTIVPRFTNVIPIDSYVFDNPNSVVVQFVNNGYTSIADTSVPEPTVTAPMLATTALLGRRRKVTTKQNIQTIGI